MASRIGTAERKRLKAEGIRVFDIPHVGELALTPLGRHMLEKHGVVPEWKNMTGAQRLKLLRNATRLWSEWDGKKRGYVGYGQDGTVFFVRGNDGRIITAEKVFKNYISDRARSEMENTPGITKKLIEMRPKYYMPKPIEYDGRLAGEANMLFSEPVVKPTMYEILIRNLGGRDRINLLAVENKFRKQAGLPKKRGRGVVLSRAELERADKEISEHMRALGRDADYAYGDNAIVVGKTRPMRVGGKRKTVGGKRKTVGGKMIRKVILKIIDQPGQRVAWDEVAY